MASGMFAGAALAAGLLLTFVAAVYRPSQVSARVLPYVATRPKKSTSKNPVSVVFANILEAVGSTTTSVERRTNMLGDLTVSDFRIRQLQWGAIGLVVGTLLAFALTVRGVPLVAAIAAIVVAVLAGVLGADWDLTNRCDKRKKSYTAQLPDVVEVLALAVASGESIRVAIDRVTHIGEGEMITELRRTMAEVHAGTPLTDALDEMGNRSGNRNVARLAEAVVTALEQGSGLATSLHSQARDARDASRRDLLEAGGKAEIAMMMPVVFIIMPLTIVFTIYPALQALRLV